jgi:hypothetical protein
MRKGQKYGPLGYSAEGTGEKHMPRGEGCEGDREIDR